MNTQNLRPPWQPGQSGNPAGYSRGRRIRELLRRLIAERGCEEEVALVLIAKALGRTEWLDGREPDLGWWRELMCYLESGEELEELRQAIASIKAALNHRGPPAPSDGPP
jgi:hypothetical protein